MGASATFLIKRGTTSEENALSIAKLFCNGRQPDITIECSGAESSICTGILVTRSGGCLVLGRDHLSFFRSIGVPDKKLFWVLVIGLLNLVSVDAKERSKVTFNCDLLLFTWCEN